MVSNFVCMEIHAESWWCRQFYSSFFLANSNMKHMFKRNLFVLECSSTTWECVIQIWVEIRGGNEQEKSGSLKIGLGLGRVYPVKFGKILHYFQFCVREYANWQLAFEPWVSYLRLGLAHIIPDASRLDLVFVSPLVEITRGAQQSWIITI